MKKRLLNIFIYVFTVEKALQHLFTALFFIVSIPGIGTPDIGNTFQISNGVMVLLNLAYFMLFVVGIIGKVKEKKWALRLVIGLALLDILLEFIFHHFFFITVSVISSTILIIISVLYLKIDKKSVKTRAMENMI
jgi:hypothetical protein